VSRRKPITQRWPNQWVFRGKVWTPERDSIATEGVLEEPVGPLIRVLMVVGFTAKTFLTPKMKTILKKALADITAEVARVSKKKKK